MEMPTKAALVTQRRHPHHHRIAELAIGEELQGASLAADLVAGVVKIGQVLDFRQRQHAQVGETLGKPKNHRLVQQGVEDARALEGLVQPLGDGVDAALLRHVLAEQQHFRVLAEQIVQRVVDVDGEVARRLVLRQLGLAAEHRQTLVAVIGADGLGIHLVRRIGRQRRHHVLQRLQARAAVGVLGGGEALAAGGFVLRQHLFPAHQAGQQGDLRRTQ